MKELERDTITTPSASMPTNSSPIAVSDESRDRRVMSVTPPIMARAPTIAPTIPGAPMSSAPAMPGSTPCASASPMNASPRSTTNVPTTAHAIETSTPASSARSMNPLIHERVDERTHDASETGSVGEHPRGRPAGRG